MEVSRLELPATTDNLAQIYNFVKNACSHVPGIEFTEEKLYNIEVSVGEYVANIIEHGYGENSVGPVIVEVEIRSDRAVITIKDHGKFFDFEKSAILFPMINSRMGGGVCSSSVTLPIASLTPGKSRITG